MAQSVKEGLPPLQLCRSVDVYTQIDGSVNKTLYFPQIELLEELVDAYPNATFLLTFRRMDDWFKSLSSWGSLWRRMLFANLTIGNTSLGAGSQEDFSDFFCEHVRRVREIVPANRLVEVDIDDPNIGSRMSDIFDIDEECWGQVNVNGKLHPDIDKNQTLYGSMTPGWKIVGKDMIRGKNGVMRKKLAAVSSSNTVEQDGIVEDKNVSLPACLRARKDTIPPSMFGKLTTPIINLGKNIFGAV